MVNKVSLYRDRRNVQFIFIVIFFPLFTGQLANSYFSHWNYFKHITAHVLRKATGKNISLHMEAQCDKIKVVK